MDTQKITDIPTYYQRYGKAWYHRNKERRKAAAKLWGQEHRDLKNKRFRELYGRRYRTAKLAKLYNVSLEEMARWLEIKACQMCGDTHKLTVDHCHKTGKIRGRLCTRCNTGLGMFRERADLLKGAITYLERNS